MTADVPRYDGALWCRASLLEAHGQPAATWPMTESVTPPFERSTSCAGCDSSATRWLPVGPERGVPRAGRAASPARPPDLTAAESPRTASRRAASEGRSSGGSRRPRGTSCSPRSSLPRCRAPGAGPRAYLWRRNLHESLGDHATFRMRMRAYRRTFFMIRASPWPHLQFHVRIPR
jgi:hypothetical protein